MGELGQQQQEKEVQCDIGRYVGDLAIKKLKEIDEVAYIRFAIVYLGLDDLDSIRAEIDRLLIGN